MIDATSVTSYAVADVVANVVGNRHGVARVVLGDAGLDLADQVGADVGGLGEDAAADPQEQCDQRSAEAETDQDRRARVLEQQDDQRGPQQAESDGEHSGDTTGAERHLERRRQRTRLGRRCGTDVAARRKCHADEPGESGQERTGNECQGAIGA
jgi:hypothetical protein